MYADGATGILLHFCAQGSGELRNKSEMETLGRRPVAQNFRRVRESYNAKYGHRAARDMKKREK